MDDEIKAALLTFLDEATGLVQDARRLMAPLIQQVEMDAAKAQRGRDVVRQYESSEGVDISASKGARQSDR